RERAVQAVARGAQLRAHAVDGRVQALQFGLDGLGRDALFGDVEDVREPDPGMAQGVAPGGAMSGERPAHQPSSSNRRSNSAATASAASASSSPSTRNSTGVPALAASSMTPLMLL